MLRPRETCQLPSVRLLWDTLSGAYFKIHFANEDMPKEIHSNHFDTSE